MAGYNGRTDGTDNDGLSYRNATAVNSQIVTQRDAYAERMRGSGNSALGLPRENLSEIFTQFNGPGLMAASYGVFLESLGQDENPDFARGQNIKTFQSFHKTKEANKLLADDEDILHDNPVIGSGPNLRVQDIDDVIDGNIVQTSQITSSLDGNRGFGWYDKNAAEKTTFGNYFKRRYSTTEQDARPSLVILGERVDVDAVDYSETPVTIEEN